MIFTGIRGHQSPIRHCFYLTIYVLDAQKLRISDIIEQHADLVRLFHAEMLPGTEFQCVPRCLSMQGQET